MKCNKSGVLGVFMICLFMSGCAGMQKMSQDEFTPGSFNMADYRLRHDSFLVILDASSSMGQTYKGMAKVNIAKNVADRLNRTLPDSNLIAGLRTFGFGDCVSEKDQELIYGLTKYSRVGFAEGLGRVNCAGGTSPMAEALDLASDDLKKVKNKIALIVISDGEAMENIPLTAAGDMKERFGNNLCIYPVTVGNNPDGKRFMERLAAVGGCGFGAEAEDIYGSTAMSEYVEKVFLEKIIDHDGDGVVDKDDICPDTKMGVAVNRFGCPPDTDRDGLVDYEETTIYKTDMNNPDTDGDGLTDGEEVMKYRTDPLNPDTDGGSVRDGHEVLVAKTDPRDPKDDVKELTCIKLEVKFEFDSDKVETIYYAEIEKAAGFLKQFSDLSLRIDGHTDNVGTDEYNNDLSLRRAKSVARIISEKYGISSQRIGAAGLGETQPIAGNDTPEGRALNRRIMATVCAP